MLWSSRRHFKLGVCRDIARSNSERPPTWMSSTFLQSTNVTTTLFPNYTLTTKAPRTGISYEKWPFRLDISTEYQDWILVGMSCILVIFWCLPCICGKMRNSCSRRFTEWIYTRLNIYFWFITYVNLAIVMFTVGVLPNWTVNEYCLYLLNFITWVLVHLKKCIMSAAILAGFLIMMKLSDKIRVAANLDHVTFINFSWREFLCGWCNPLKKRPIEVFIWKVEDLQSSTKIYKPNDIYIECHMGDNEPVRTRVHNNAGSSGVIKESFQINIYERDAAALMTLLVKDQALMVSSELGRLVLSTREVCGIEDQTGKRKDTFEYSEASFVPLKMLPMGKIWIAIAPVEDQDEERKPLMREDDTVTC